MYTVNYTNFFEFGVDAGDAHFQVVLDDYAFFDDIPVPIRFFCVPQYRNIYVSQIHMYAFT